ncbi:MAG TPA: hexitol phosphatase HxpB [Pseudomonadales bacterium]
MNLQAAIFDMDGLLIDSEPLWHKAEIAVFATVGLHLTTDQCRETTGVRIDEVVRIRHRQKPWHGKSIELVESEIVAEVERLTLSEGAAMPGVYALLEHFASAGVRMAVASSSPAPMIEAVVNHLGIARYFETLCSAADEEHGKPHPAVYLSAARALRVEPGHCLAFEDSIPGVQAAHAAGMTVIAVPDAHHFARPEYGIAAQKLKSLVEFNPSAYLQLPEGA